MKFCKHFRITFSNSEKKEDYEIFIDMALDLGTIWGSISILAILNLTIHEQRISFYSLMSSLISFLLPFGSSFVVLAIEPSTSA
jgi:hypothetical protein